MSKENQEHKIPAWLQRIQDNSSELELLISGGAIYALLKLSDAMKAMGLNLKMALGSETGLWHVFDQYTIAVAMLSIGFILHLVIRGYWLALVCLNYVFPNGIKFENLKFHAPFTINKIERNDLYEQILKADKWCGLIMFSSIGSTILFIFLFFPGFLMNVIRASIEPSAIFNVINKVYFYTFVIYLVDLLLSGLFRKIPYISYIIYPVFKFLDLITLRFLVQKGFWILNSNTSFYKRSLVFSVFIFMASIGAAVKMSPDIGAFEERYYLRHSDQNYYRDVQQSEELTYLLVKPYTIDSNIMSKSFITLQIRITKNISNYIEEKFDAELEMLNGKEYDEKVKEKFQDLYTISLNDIVLESIDWTVWRTSRYDYGIECVIPIAHLEYGKHLISIDDKSKFHKKKDEEGKINQEKSKPTNITFWYDKFAANNK